MIRVVATRYVTFEIRRKEVKVIWEKNVPARLSRSAKAPRKQCSWLFGRASQRLAQVFGSERDGKMLTWILGWGGFCRAQEAAVRTLSFTL